MFIRTISFWINARTSRVSQLLQYVVLVCSPHILLSSLPRAFVVIKSLSTTFSRFSCSFCYKIKPIVSWLQVDFIWVTNASSFNYLSGVCYKAQKEGGVTRRAIKCAKAHDATFSVWSKNVSSKSANLKRS